MMGPKAPRLITFEGLHAGSKWSWALVEFREPKEGEYYLSGAEPQAYQAYSDMSSKYWVVTPLLRHTQQTVWLPIAD